MSAAEVQGQCVLCSSVFITATGKKKNADRIKYQVRTIFVLRKLLKISSSTCCDLLQRGNPSDWFSYCVECFETVIEAERLYSKLMKLEAKWNDLKQGVREKIYEEHHQRKAPPTRSNSANNEDIIYRIRNEAVKRIQSDNAKNNTKPICTEDEVKIEIAEQDYLSEDPLSIPDGYESNEECDTEALNNTSRVLKIGNHQRPVNKDSSLDEASFEEDGYCNSKNRVIRRTRSGRMIKSKYDSVSDDDCGTNVTNENEPSKNLDVTTSHLIEVFSCPQCERVFKHPEGLNYHQRRFHGADDEKPYRCTVCGKGMHMRRSLFRHMQKKHPGQVATMGAIPLIPFPCDQCQSTFTTESQLKLHICGGTTEDHSFECLKCGKLFVTAKLLEMHNKSHATASKGESQSNEDPAFKCQKCTRTFTTLLGRRRHYFRVHVSAKEKPYRCGKCDKGFVIKKNLRYHDEKQHNAQPRVKSKEKKDDLVVKPPREKIFPCSQCKLMFASEGILEGHIRKKHDKNLFFPCPLCPKKFKYSTLTKIHLRRVHQKERNYICEICSKPFVYWTQLRFHQMREHGTKEELTCKECGHISADPSSLKKHITAIHDKNNFPFKCPICSLGAISKSALDSHILGRHTNEKPFTCTLCDRSYVSNSSLKIHMQSHTGERPYSCRFCKKGFNTMYKMKRHEEDLHSTEKKYQCDTCGKRFPSKHYLQTHVYDTHRKRQKDPVPEKVLINDELLTEVIIQNRTETMKPNAIGLFLEKSLQKAQDSPSQTND